MLAAPIPLSVVLGLVSIDQLADAMLEVAPELAVVDVSVGKGILALALPDTVNVLTLVNLAVGIGGGALAGEVLGGVSGLGALGDELVGHFLLLLLCHG